MADGARKPQDRSQRAAALDPRLMLWLSPAFPVGAFAFSHGLEQAAAGGWLPGRPGLEVWLRDLIEHGSLRNDLILLAESWRAAADRNLARLHEANELALALQPSSERHLETRTQGNAFLATVVAAWPSTGLEQIRAALERDVAYPIAFGAAAATHEIGLEAGLLGYGLAFAGNLVSAAIRLSVIGQTDGQRVLAALLPALEAAATSCLNRALDEIGSATFRSDIAQLRHETQYTRLFRS